MCAKHKMYMVVTSVLFMLVSSLSLVYAQNPMPQGLDYPFHDSQDWKIINGYNDGNRHGGSPNVDDWRFYAYYGFDFVRNDGGTAGQTVYAPANIYYYRVQNSDEKCIDMAIGTFTQSTDLYLEMCHVDYTSAILQGKPNVQYTFIPKGTAIGTVASVCPSCSTPHIHMAAVFAPAGSPWDNTGYCYDDILAFCRLPIAYQSYANFSLTLGGDNYPPLESQLFQRSNQYDDTPLDNVGGGSSEGSGGSGSIGDNTVDIREYKNYNGSQYGSSDPNAGIINIPGGQNDRNESIQIDAGWSVMVYQEFNGGGGKRCFNQSIPNLEHSVFDNSVQVINGISSFRVYNESTCGGQMPVGVAPGDTVTVYAGFNWEGTSYGGHGTAVFNLPDYVEGATSSIGVYPGRSALLYEFDNQQGGTQCFSGSDPDLRDNFYHNGHVIDDNIHSLRLFENGNCGGWSPPLPTINGINFDWTGGTSVHLAFVFENADPLATHTVAWICDSSIDTFTGAMNAVNLNHNCPTSGSVSAVITVYGVGSSPGIGGAEVTIPEITATPSNTPVATSTDVPTATPSNTPTTGVDSSGTGLTGEYFNGTSLSGESSIRVDPVVSIDTHGSPHPFVGADNFSIRWTGFIEPLYGEAYQICTYSDDGIRVYFSGQLVIDNWTAHGGTLDCANVGNLTAGAEYPVVVEYYEQGGGAVAQLGWSSPSQEEDLIPQSQLYPASVATATPSSTATATDTPEFTNTPTSTSTETSTVTATNTASPTPTPTETPTATDTSVPPQGVELLSEPWVLDGGFGAEEEYQGIDENALVGMDTLRVTYNLHGLNALGGDASALIFDQNGWQYASLSNYGQNGYDGVQVVEIPLSHFGDLDLNEEVGTFHTRFWCDCAFYVEIISAVAFDSPNY